MKKYDKSFNHQRNYLDDHPNKEKIIQLGQQI